ncbi:MAG: hypothetical protein M0034_02595 [Deltaproteobacteria bacterium]|nr:hypothetical protein [Deltaproteobacteria bacterium]
MDAKDKSIIDKILKIAGVDACAVSSLDGEVLRYETNDGEILPEQINKVSLEISKLFASYSISSIDITSLYLNFDDRNIIVNGFGSGFIFILSKRNSNVNLLKMETSYLESEFIKIVSQSLGSISEKPPLINAQAAQTVDNTAGAYSKNESEDVFNAFFGGKSGGEVKTHKLISKNDLDSIKDIFSSSLGPISAILFDEKIKELNENVDNFNAENIENLINRLSDEIEGKKDRLNFITAAKNIIN